MPSVYPNTQTASLTQGELLDLNSQEALTQVRDYAEFGRAVCDENYRAKGSRYPQYFLMRALAASKRILRGQRGNSDNVAGMIAAGAAVFLSVVESHRRSRRTSYGQQEQLYYLFMDALPPTLPNPPFRPTPDEAIVFLEHLVGCSPEQNELPDPRDRRENVLDYLQSYIDFGEAVRDLASSGFAHNHANILRASRALDCALYSTMDCADDARRFSREYPGRFDQIIRSEVVPLASAAALVMEMLAGPRLLAPRKQERFISAFQRAMRASPNRYLIPPKPATPPAIRAFLWRLAPAAGVLGFASG
jgi:hypothetical protein